VTGPLTVRVRAAFTNVAVGFAVALTAEIEGRASASAWAFGDGVVVMDQPYASHAWTTPGDYVVVLMAFNESQPGGVSATQTVHVLALPVHYVASGSSNPQPPYTSWATAARTIQEAVDAATSAGALVLVTNGIYATGGRAVYSTMTNRVAVTKPLAVRSVNGPQFTLIQGRQVPGITNGSGAIRCVYLTNGASLSGFTLTNGATLNQGGVDSRDANGGGVWCEMADAVITNCTLTGNSANWDGGGAYYGTFNNCTLTGNSAADRGGGVYLGNLYNCTLTGNFVLGISAACFGGGVSDSTLNNCVLTGNSAPNGGGANSGTLNNCTLTANSATYGGGAYLADLYNCIVYFNSAVEGANYDGGSLNYCCTTPLPGGGTGNLDQDPQLASASHLSLGSPCRGAGRAAYARGLDIDGEAWASPPSIGCDEYRDGEVTGPLTVRVRAAFTNVAVGFAVGLTAEIEGRTSASAWAFGDGLAASNRPYASHAWTAPGDYAVVLTALNESQPGGVSATQTIHVLALPVHYVASGSSDPQPPYTNWATAARTIQEAVDAATSAGALVLVTNGIYADGGRAVYTTMTNRVAVTKPLTLRSVNGPQFTLIQGRQVPGSTNGTGAIRCVYLTNGASLSGFTLTNGATRILGDSDHEASGGGVWCELADAVITNCTLTGNSAFSSGGGVYWGTLYNCTLTANSADFGGGAYNGRLNNCIVYFNTGSSSGPNYFVATLNYCCTTPLPAGVGNITNTPLFVDQIGQNYRLQSSSPCIDAGLNTYAGGPTDLDGNPRIVNGTVDMGAYEFQLLRGVDIGLRLFDGSATKRIACEPSGPGGVLLSSLRIAKNGTNYGILLVATNALDASRLQIQTPTGIKALKKLP
jgi:parallel beta-helix repeat protein